MADILPKKPIYKDEMEKNLKSKQRKLRLIFLKLSGFHPHLYQATHTSSCLLSCWPHRNICPGLQNHHSQPHLHHCFYIIIDSGIMRCPAGDEETPVEMLLLNHGDILGMAEERREVHTAQEQAIHHWVIEFYEEALTISAGKLLLTSAHINLSFSQVSVSMMYYTWRSYWPPWRR